MYSKFKTHCFQIIKMQLEGTCVFQQLGLYTPRSNGVKLLRMRCIYVQNNFQMSEKKALPVFQTHEIIGYYDLCEHFVCVQSSVWTTMTSWTCWSAALQTSL